MILKNKVTIITGASRGIGRSISLLFAKEGAKVVLTARDFKTLKILEREIEKSGGEAYSISTDMRVRNEVKKLMYDSFKKFNRVDILVNNAGLPMYGFAIDDKSNESENRYDAIMETNLRGYWYSARFAVPFMKQGHYGSILNISSVRGKLGLANETAYCAAKGAINMFTKSLAIELAPHKIRVNSISPAAIQVENIGHWVLSRYGEKAHEYYLKKFKKLHLLAMKINQPLEIIGRVEDIAKAALFLCSDDARFVTGSDLTVDGGLTSLLPEPNALNLKKLCEYYDKSKDLIKWLKKQS